MKLNKKYACRGDGHAYIEYETTDLHEGSMIEVSAHIPQGNLCPAEIYLTAKSIDKKNFVLVLPLIENKIIVTFIESDQKQNQLSLVKKTIDPFIIKWESRINYRFNGQAVNFIRNIDISALISQPTFTLIATIPSSSETIFQMNVLVPNYEPMLENIQVYDKNLKQISPKLILLSKGIRKDDPLIDTWFGSLTFSIVFPNPCESFLVTIDDPEGNFKTGFFGFGDSSIKNAIGTRSIETLSAADDSSYMSHFLRERCTREQAKLEAMHLNAKEDILPLFSIIVPLYKTPKNFFIEMINSVKNQGYEKFELILVNVLEGNEGLRQIIDEYQAKDKRIKEVKVKENLGITQNTYIGIKAAVGNYVSFFDHDDTLEPNILLEYAKHIIRNQNIGLLYCDEDKLYENGKYGSPYFKPDFSFYMLREMNYICHLLTVKRSLLDNLDINDSAYDGAQDHNLSLQVAEQNCDICHIKKVLYHWRVSSTSTASSSDSKSYANEAGKLAIQRHLKRIQRDAEVLDTAVPFTHNIKYHYNGNKLISIIIPTKDNVEILNRCVNSILQKSTYQNYEIILVENNSVDAKTFENYENLKQLDNRIQLINFEDSFNFSAIINLGAKEARGDYFLLLNNDTEIITPDWLENMLGICEDEKVGIVGAKLYYPDNTIQHAGVRVCGMAAGHLNNRLHKTAPGYYGTAIVNREVSAVTGACLLVKKKVFESVGGFDETFAVAFNDIDFCLKVRKLGLLVIYNALTELYHYESISRGLDTTREKRIRLMQETSRLREKWPYYYVDSDPYYNPNLKQENDFFALKSPNDWQW